MLFLESLLSSHQYHPEVYHPGAVPHCLSQTLQQNRSHHLKAAQLNGKITFQESNNTVDDGDSTRSTIVYICVLT